MLTTFLLIALMILGHWLGDFVLQSEETAVVKHKDLNLQCIHALTYSLAWIPIGFLVMWFGLLPISVVQIFLFYGITALSHLIIDLTISKLGYKYFHNNNPNSFLGIMHVDQLLHYLQLFLTYKLLF
jgi:hypothetical protein